MAVVRGSLPEEGNEELLFNRYRVVFKEISTEYPLEGLMLKLNSSTLVTQFEEVTHLKRPGCWERLKAGGERDVRG